ncbi:hypothetical protein [Streptomyces sp. CNZ748]|uniref:hypothetical protein n=1 Tax=Streptomyces sp. CNZ748 TaxID=2885160 RepID=UPI001E4CFCF8|nr:hypothetical protein [Streptomyces sp. CNZ748]
MTAPAVPGGVVAEFGTGYLATRVLTAERGYLWCRGPGPARPRPFTPVPDAVADASRAWTAHGARVVLGAPGRPYPEDRRPDRTRGDAASERHYRVPAPYSLGHVLGNHAAAPLPWAALPRLLHQVGTVLRRVHTAFADSPVPGGPAGAARVAGWLAGTPVTPAAGRLRQEALARLGGARMRRAAEWCADLAAGGAGERPVLLLGGVSLGSVIPSPRGDACAVLAGEELATGRAAFDLGWTVGELAEFRLLHFTDPGSGAAAEHCARAARALLSGYATATDPAGPRPGPADTRPGPADPGPDLDAVARSAVLRVLAHGVDYAAFVGWRDQLTSYLDVVAGLLDHPLGTIEGPPGAPAGRRTGPGTEEQ